MDDETATVGCTLPNGLVIYGYTDHGEDNRAWPLFAGGRWTRTNKTAVLRGTNNPPGDLAPHAAQRRDGITQGVDKGLFDSWMAANADSALVTGGSVYDHEKRRLENIEHAEAAKAEQAERDAARVDPNAPPAPPAPHPEMPPAV